MAQRFRILHALSKMAVGGSVMNTLISCREMIRRGYPSSVVVGPERPVEGDLFALADQWKVPVIFASHLYRSLNPFRDLLATQQLSSILRRGNFSILHTHSAKTRVLGRIAARRVPGTKVVQTAHGWTFCDQQTPVRKSLYVALEKLGFSLADATIVVTPRDIDKGVAAGIGREEDYTVIRSGVEFEAFRSARGTGKAARASLGIPPDVPVVGSVMRLCWQKAPLDFVETARRIRTAVPDATFLVVGEGPLRGAMECSIERAGLSGCFMMLGERNDVDRILQAMDIFLLTSRFEGLPRALLEALAAGIPSVATDVGGVSELLKDGRFGSLVRAGDLQGAAEAVVGLLEADPSTRADLMNGIDTALEPFSASRMVDDLQHLYENLVEDGSVKK